jgi:hypothetical protein
MEDKMSKQGIDVQYATPEDATTRGQITYGADDPVSPSLDTQYEASAAGDITLDAETNYLAIADDAGIRNVDLPAISAVDNGHEVTVCRLGGGGANIVVRASGADTINDGSTAAPLDGSNNAALAAENDTVSVVAVINTTVQGWYLS